MIKKNVDSTGGIHRIGWVHNCNSTQRSDVEQCRHEQSKGAAVENIGQDILKL